MINFACRKIKLEELIRCSLGLSRSDYKLFDFLLNKEGNHTIKDLSEELSLDRTTIQKSMKKLLEAQVVKQLQENLSPGGYRFVYKIKDKKAIKNMMFSIIDKWNGNVRNVIKSW